MLSSLLLPANAKLKNDVAARKIIVKQAKKWIGPKRSYFQVKGKRFRFDCSGFVQACYHAADRPLKAHLRKNQRNIQATTLRLYHSLKSKTWRTSAKKPRPGDLIFFHNTYDRNRNHRWDDLITHIALIEKIERDGTIKYLHVSSKGVKRDCMNLRYPKSHLKDGKVVNDFLRRRPPSDLDRGKYTSASLFACFASVIR